jgi:small subunit ribosomal protein S6
VSALRRYETIFVLRPDLGESVQKEAIRRFESIVRTTAGEMIETDEWGFRELAYRIKGERRGFYVRLDYGGNGATMNEIERNLKLSDSVLRYLSVLVDSDIEPASVRAELETHRRRSAEARAAAEAARAAAEATRAAAEATRANAEATRAAAEAARANAVAAREAAAAAEAVVDDSAPSLAGEGSSESGFEDGASSEETDSTIPSGEDDKQT